MTKQKPVLTAMQGLPGSDKTTEALAMMQRNPLLVRVNRDDLRAMLGNRKYSRANETAVTELQHALIRSALLAGKPVVCDDTNLNPSTVEMLQEVAEECDAAFVIDKQYLNVPIQECVARDLARDRTVGVEAILRMHLQYLALPIQHLPDTPSCAIVDIDGTVAHATRRNVHDLTKVYLD